MPEHSTYDTCPPLYLVVRAAGYTFGLKKTTTRLHYCSRFTSQVGARVGAQRTTNGSRCSTKIHGLRHPLMRLAKAPLKLTSTARRRRGPCRVGGLCRDVRHEQTLTLLRVVMVLCTGAHVVRV